MVIGGWVALVVVALGLIQGLLPSATTTDFRLAGRYESERAAALLEERLRGPEKLAEIVIVQSETLTVDDEAFRAKVEAVHEDIFSLGPGTIAGGIDGQPLFHYYQAIDAGPLIPQEQLARLLPLLVSADRQTVLVHYTLAGTSQEATANVADVIHKVEEADEADDFRVLVGGGTPARLSRTTSWRRRTCGRASSSEYRWRCWCCWCCSGPSRPPCFPLGSRPSPSW